jgi:hypothetical protein
VTLVSGQGPVLSIISDEHHQLTGIDDPTQVSNPSMLTLLTLFAGPCIRNLPDPLIRVLVSKEMTKCLVPYSDTVENIDNR